MIINHPAPRDAKSGWALPRSTRSLLLAGAFAGPLFYLSAIVQMLTRPGFDVRIHPLSQLSTGDLGWIQILTFVLVGLGLICLSVGHRRVVTGGIGRAAIPVLIAIGGRVSSQPASSRRTPRTGSPSVSPTARPPNPPGTLSCTWWRRSSRSPRWPWQPSSPSYAPSASDVWPPLSATPSSRSPSSPLSFPKLPAFRWPSQDSSLSDGAPQRPSNC